MGSEKITVRNTIFVHVLSSCIACETLAHMTIGGKEQTSTTKYYYGFRLSSIFASYVTFRIHAYIGLKSNRIEQ